MYDILKAVTKHGRDLILSFTIMVLVINFYANIGHSRYNGYFD